MLIITFVQLDCAAVPGQSMAMATPTRSKPTAITVRAIRCLQDVVPGTGSACVPVRIGWWNGRAREAKLI